MEHNELVLQLWDCIHRQNWERLPSFFSPAAVIRWPNTGEEFTVDEFVAANRAYPGNWHIQVERVEEAGEVVITVSKVTLAQGEASFHAVSFFTVDAGAVTALTEYWGDDGLPPDWRRELGIGRPITQRT